MRFLREALRPLFVLRFFMVCLERRPPIVCCWPKGGAAATFAAGAAGSIFLRLFAGAFFLPVSQSKKPIYLRWRFTRRLLRLRFLRVCLRFLRLRRVFLRPPTETGPVGIFASVPTPPGQLVNTSFPDASFCILLRVYLYSPIGCLFGDKVQGPLGPIFFGPCLSVPVLYMHFQLIELNLKFLQALILILFIKPLSEILRKLPPFCESILKLLNAPYVRSLLSGFAKESLKNGVLSILRAQVEKY